MTTRQVRPILCFLAGSVLATSLFAQAPAPKLAFPNTSQTASVKQQVGVTDIEVNYARPSVKGRTIFGGLVPYGEVWRTGANTATKISFSTAVKLNGAAVPAGTYEFFTIPGKTEWTIILQGLGERTQWGAYGYDQKHDTVRVTATPTTLANTVESLSIGFSDLRSNAATLNIAWEKTRVPVKLEVDVVGQLVPQIEAVMASAEPKKPYFPAAMFYFENDLDLKKAIEWIDAGLAEQPTAFFMTYRKGLILAKAGDKAGAIVAAQQSLEMAKKATPPALREEYVRLNEALIASLQ
ncbi:MAG: DUF2911 domain-containing protein [Opitutae bacterium]|nr:DUF2911 domain-containing protein [Opitutae bacterium]